MKKKHMYEEQVTSAPGGGGGDGKKARISTLDKKYEKRIHTKIDK